jgi:hypothetical protein
VDVGEEDVAGFADDTHVVLEPSSELSRNFLVIAPNIIVLDRLRADFDGQRCSGMSGAYGEEGNSGCNDMAEESCQAGDDPAKQIDSIFGDFLLRRSSKVAIYIVFCSDALQFSKTWQEWS